MSLFLNTPKNNNFSSLKSEYLKYHNTYLDISLSQGFYYGKRKSQIKKRIDYLYDNYKNLLDENFLGEIKTDFDKRSWELYILDLLLGNNEQLKETNLADFCIPKKNIYVECCSLDKGQDNLPDTIPKQKYQIVQDVQYRKASFRIASLLSNKKEQYDKNFKKNVPNKYVIAINSSDYENAKLLTDSFLFDLFFNKKKFLQKYSGAPVELGIFEQKTFQFLSGIIYSPLQIIDSGFSKRKSCILIKNPNAKNQLGNCLDYLTEYIP